MEDSRKKKIMIIIIVISFVTASIITFSTLRPRGPDIDVFKGKMIWVNCYNPDCGAGYQVDKKWYFEYIQEDPSSMWLGTPGLVCEKCEQKTVYRVVKCPQCEEVFFRGSVQGDFADRCPECNYSETEAERTEFSGKKRTN